MSTRNIYIYIYIYPKYKWYINLVLSPELSNLGTGPGHPIRYTAAFTYTTLLRLWHSISSISTAPCILWLASIYTYPSLHQTKISYHKLSIRNENSDTSLWPYLTLSFHLWYFLLLLNCQWYFSVSCVLFFP
jgi:hypothetical protein